MSDRTAVHEHTCKHAHEYARKTSLMPAGTPRTSRTAIPPPFNTLRVHLHCRRAGRPTSNVSPTAALIAPTAIDALSTRLAE
eukprot:5539138-Pleurochrysis_carterae.AAC.2